jgi:cysteine-rich repeat protein
MKVNQKGLFIAGLTDILVLVGTFVQDIVYMYRWIGGHWFEEPEIISSGEEDDFGLIIAMDGDFIGISTQDNINLNQNAPVYLFEFDSSCPGDVCFPDEYCGDGLIQEEVEECDDSLALPGDGCSEICMVEEGWTCLEGEPSVCFLDADGDGIEDSVDNCPEVENPGQEDSNDNGIGDACEWYDVFITSEKYFGSEIQGIQGAHQICSNHANSAGLEGNWKAWISDSTQSPSTYFFHSDVKYQLLNEDIVALNWEDLIDGLLLEPISTNEFGQAVTGWNVWTGTNADGTPHSNNCNDWTGSGLARRGKNAQTDDDWTTDSSVSCGGTQDYHIYCFEQP